MKVSLIIFLIGFLTIAPSIWIGVKYFDGKVVDQPYETGLKYDENKKLIADNGMKLDVVKYSLSDEIVQIYFTLDRNEDAKVTDTEFYLTRPATDKGIVKLDVQMADEWLYSTSLALAEHGHYLLKAKAKIDGKDVMLQKSFYID
jgi:nitrogen fixation protein FixH